MSTEEAKRVCSMWCLAGAPPDFALCVGPVGAVRVGDQITKGGRFDLVPLCLAHAVEAGEAGTLLRADFERHYGIDLRAEADRIAFAGAKGWTS